MKTDYCFDNLYPTCQPEDIADFIHSKYHRLHSLILTLRSHHTLINNMVSQHHLVEFSPGINQGATPETSPLDLTSMCVYGKGYWLSSNA